MRCPVCRSAEGQRSRRQSLKDHALSAVGLLPWRCAGCELRFYAMVVPIRQFFYAHCPHCGNLELRPISRDLVLGYSAFLGRILRLPSWRCHPCRHNFFSIGPLRRLPSPPLMPAKD